MQTASISTGVATIGAASGATPSSIAAGL
ncbi:hypothetical protein, partial [Bradyrhizobium guangdongense]